MTTAPLNFVKRSAAALEDDQLQDALQKAQKGLFASTDVAMAHPDFQIWRREGQRLRGAALANLDLLLERFEEQASKAGTRIHWAASASEARNLVSTIGHEHGCRMAIKSKSMLSEEIQLNEALQNAGIEVLETDLGEYVLQLCAGRPSHIIAPIVHMNKTEISELFSAKHGTPLTNDTRKLVAEARRVLRPRMLAADLGITGANFLVAATGSSVIVTNEGNGRFTATLPKVLITIAGIEKLIPSFTELATMLRLLPRAATGQSSSAYVTISTGPATGGPAHHHVILIDNGRSKMLADKYRPMLTCIRCGACMNHCPVYLTVGGLSYNSPYVGPMGAVLSPNLFGRSHDDLPHGSTLCGACDNACPVKIPLANMLRMLREDQVAAGVPGPLANLLFATWAALARRPALYGLVERLAARVLKLLGGANGRLSKLPGGKGWFAWRDLRVPTDPPRKSRQQQPPEQQ